MQHWGEQDGGVRHTFGVAWGRVGALSRVHWTRRCCKVTHTRAKPWLSVLATTREGYPLPPTTCSTSTTATYAVRTALFEAGDGVTPSSGAPGGPRLLLLLCFFPCGVCGGSVCATGCENREHIVRPLLVAARTFAGVPCPICLRMCSGNCFEVVPLWGGVDARGVRHKLHRHRPVTHALLRTFAQSLVLEHA